MKVLTIILGALLILGGMYCMFAPIATYSALSWLIGIAMLVEGIGSVVTWNDRRRIGIADGWTLVGAILSIVLGVFLLISYVARFTVDMFIAYLIAIWLVFGGIARIIAAMNLRNYQNQLGAGAAPGNWVALLILGIALVVLGILCIFNPVSIMVGVGFLLGLSIVFSGVGLVVGGFRMQS